MTHKLKKQFENILKMSQADLKIMLTEELHMLGYTPVSRKGFLYAAGSVPVMLVAHLDTVHHDPVNIICYSEDQRFIMSPEGIGGDDRCGVYMIMEIIQSVRCHVLFTEDEECGCIGARKFANSSIVPQLNYIVEVDRRGRNDAVFYDCNNPDFSEWILSFGFRKAHGSFSDISAIAPELGIAAVNISAGYYNAHRRHEYIDLKAVEKNIKRICAMIQIPTDPYEYIELNYFSDQYLFEEQRLWDTPYLSDETEHTKALMPLPKTAIIMMGGGYECSAANLFFMDKHGNVYRYLEDVNAAVPSETARAYDDCGQPTCFNSKKAKKIKTILLEEVIAL